MRSSLAAVHHPDATQALGHKDSEVPQSLSGLPPVSSPLLGGEDQAAVAEGSRKNGEFWGWGEAESHHEPAAPTTVLLSVLRHHKEKLPVSEALRRRAIAASVKSRQTSHFKMAVIIKQTNNQPRNKTNKYKNKQTRKPQKITSLAKGRRTQNSVLCQGFL